MVDGAGPTAVRCAPALLSLGARGCAPPAPELAHRPHDAYVGDVEVALSDLQLSVTEKQLDLTDIEAVLEPP